MKRNACIRPGYYRITIYSVAKLRTPDLFTLALMSYGRDVLDGRLCHELRNATGFRFFGTSLKGTATCVWPAVRLSASKRPTFSPVTDSSRSFACLPRLAAIRARRNLPIHQLPRSGSFAVVAG